jgi:hypothetical protein
MYESLENDPTLKHIETTDETEKYELVRNSESMKIFLVRTREQNFPNWKPVTLTINLIDQGRWRNLAIECFL